MPIKNVRFIENTNLVPLSITFCSLSLIKKKLILGRFSMKVGHSPLLKIFNFHNSSKSQQSYLEYNYTVVLSFMARQS